MTLSPQNISKVNSTKRCGSDNIREITEIFKGINNRVRVLLKKILAGGTRLEEKEARELQQLLRMQSKLIMMPMDPGTGSVDRNLFDNQCHRVVHIKETIKEIERRHKYKLLDDY